MDCEFCYNICDDYMNYCKECDVSLCDICYDSNYKNKEYGPCKMEKTLLKKNEI